MRHRNTSLYSVKRSIAPYATIISSHCTLHEAYKAMVKAHRAHFKNHRFILAQAPIVIISTEAATEVIQAHILAWATKDMGPPSKKRLPLPIVVHQWSPANNVYKRFREPSE